MKHFMTIIFLLAFTVSASSQRADFSKMSSLLRQLSMTVSTENEAKNTDFSRAFSPRRAVAGMQNVQNRHRPTSILSFVRTTTADPQALTDNHCRVITQYGDLFIADIPLSSLPALSLDRRIVRIEASRASHLTMDTTATCVNALPAYEGLNLPQAFTGKDVVMGVMDVGFDLTHPNFYDASTTNYRIKSLWDQLSTDTIGSSLYVGNQYTTTEQLLDYAHSRDGLIQTHGTHTLGSAAGSGYNSKCRGIAWESDICLVSNAVTEDAALIDSADYYKYTYATDALGFKYIFDYAESVGKPCVISFSEGSHQDFYGDDLLYYAMLDSLTSQPGRIIVSSAGNEGEIAGYMHKPQGKASVGSFLYSGYLYGYFTLKANSDFDMRIKVYGDSVSAFSFNPYRVFEMPDSEYVDTLQLAGKQYIIDVVGYTSCYDSAEQCFDVMLLCDHTFGYNVPVSIELIGENPDIRFYRGNVYLTNNSLDASLSDGEATHNVLSPSSSPNVICVGASAYRTAIKNYLGKTLTYNKGTNGTRSTTSSVGPTYDERIKPDVMAPGVNIISSYSSYYLEENPKAFDIGYDVQHFAFNGRIYAWNANSGTSMSAPVVGGAIALWLQANPSLTTNDILGILSRTCSHPDSSLSYPNNYYGYGQIDVYAGLLDILGLSNIKSISRQQPSGITITPDGNRNIRLAFTSAPAKPFTVTVYTVAGAKLLNLTCQPHQSDYIISLPASTVSGIYAVQITSSEKQNTGSSLIRL